MASPHTEKVKAILMEEFEIEASEINDEANLFAELGLDSLDGVDLVVAIEKEFGVKINQERLKEIKLVSDIYEAINEAKS